MTARSIGYRAVVFLICNNHNSLPFNPVLNFSKWENIKLANSKATRKRDVEKAYPKQDFIAKLRRLADALERDQPFRLQVAGQRIAVPKQAIINIEHERGAQQEEIEFQIKWQIAPPARKDR